MRLLARSLAFVLLSGFAFGQQVINGAGGSFAPSTNSWALAQNCAGITNCTQIFGDTQTVFDATLNGTTTITCPNSDCNFTQADVGKTVWATTLGSGPSIHNDTTLQCAVTTISTVNSAQSITVANACSGSGTANQMLIWGHRDGATLAALDGNAVGCVTITPFNGANIMIDRAIFITSPTCQSTGLSLASGYPQKDWIPVGNTVVLILTPDFNWSSCTGTGTQGGVCIGTGLSEMDNTGIWGTGVRAASNANCNNANAKTVLQMSPVVAAMKNTNVSGICPGTPGYGAVMSTTDEYWIGGGVQFTLLNPCYFVGSSMFTQVLDCRNDTVGSSYGLTVAGGASVTDISTFPIVGMQIANGGVFQSRGTHYFGGNAVDCINVNSGGTFYSYGDYIGTDSPQSGTACLDINGQVQLANTQLSATATNRAIGMGTGTLIDLGGNTIKGTSTLITWFTGWSATGPGILQGSCTGTVTSASTIGLFGLGNNTTTTCTSTTTNLGPVMGKSGTIFGFGCQAGTAGNQAADACTVMKNNVATSLTCSLNGATSCGDGAVAHQTSYVVGDIITVKVVSGTSTTLANVKASVIAW